MIQNNAEGLCARCDKPLTIGKKAYWDNAIRRRVCLECGDVFDLTLTSLARYLSEMEMWRKSINRKLNQVLQLLNDQGENNKK
jgi:hypothetical protein